MKQTQRTVAVLSAATFLSGAATRVCDGLLPRLGGEFGTTPGVAGYVVTVFAMAYSVLQLLFGPLGDRLGKARVIVVAIVGSLAASVVAAASPTFHMLLAARCAWGMAAAGVVPLAMAWIGDTVPLDERQPMLARLLVGTLSGMTAGQLLGGLFADQPWGWRGAFGVLALAYACVAVLLIGRFRSTGWSPPTPAGQRLPLHRQWHSVLKERWSWVVLGASLIEGVLLFGPLAYMPALLHARFDLTLTHASALLALFAIGGLAYAVAARTIVRRLGQRRMVIAGGVIMGLGCLAWLLSPVVWITGPVALLVGFGTYLYHATLQTHATQMAPAARGTSVSLFAAFFFAGQALGAALAGAAFDHLGAAWMLMPSVIMLPVVGWAYARALGRHTAI
ncbi:MFS transporter [Ramlibacter humi]|uniref:MFS transporter n=1 Tax=Ramlibacter humi TaxID=2530451 RepID=A0A4Z0BJY2_9BURK|nr:MFS transporter [Ramlibacter humi]